MMYTYECMYEDCPEIATIKEWRLNYYFYKCSECALNDLRKQLREEKNYELLHKTRT